MSTANRSQRASARWLALALAVSACGGQRVAATALPDRPPIVIVAGPHLVPKPVSQRPVIAERFHRLVVGGCRVVRALPVTLPRWCLPERERFQASNGQVAGHFFGHFASPVVGVYWVQPQSWLTCSPAQHLPVLFTWKTSK